MAQHGKDLTVKHLDTNAADRAEPTREDFLEVVDFEEVALGFELLANLWRSFVVFVRHLSPFELIIVLAV